MTKDDSKTGKILSNIADGIVYTPLVLIGLTVLYGIGYGVWYYRQNGEISDKTAWELLKHPEYERYISYL